MLWQSSRREASAAGLNGAVWALATVSKQQRAVSEGL